VTQWQVDDELKRESNASRDYWENLGPRKHRVSSVQPICQWSERDGAAPTKQAEGQRESRIVTKRSMRAPRKTPRETEASNLEEQRKSSNSSTVPLVYAGIRAHLVATWAAWGVIYLAVTRVTPLDPALLFINAGDGVVSDKLFKSDAAWGEASRFQRAGGRLLHFVAFATSSLDLSRPIAVDLSSSKRERDRTRIHRPLLEILREATEQARRTVSDGWHEYDSRVFDERDRTFLKGILCDAKDCGKTERLLCHPRQNPFGLIPEGKYWWLSRLDSRIRICRCCRRRHGSPINPYRSRPNPTDHPACTCTEAINWELCPTRFASFYCRSFLVGVSPLISTPLIIRVRLRLQRCDRKLTNSSLFHGNKIRIKRAALTCNLRKLSRASSRMLHRSNHESH